MSKKNDIHLSILIVSTSEKFVAIVKKSLAGFSAVDVRKSAAMARRCMLERNYDLVVIDAPLSDESGEDLVVDMTENYNTSILIVTPQEVYDVVSEHLADYGILVVSKPISSGNISRAIRFLSAIQNRIHTLENKMVSVQEKMEELRLVSRAKILLIEKKNMTEDTAHRFIGKQAMDNGVSRKTVAKKILEDLE